MKSRAVSFATIGFMFWLYGGDALLRVDLAQTEWVATMHVPGLLLTCGGLALALALLASFTVEKGARWRSGLLAACLTWLSFDFGVVSAARPLESLEEVSASAVSVLAEELVANAHAGGSIDVNALQRVVTEWPAPPYFHHGVQLPHWQLEVHRRCDGPLRDVGERTPGTLLVCMSESHQAWVTAVIMRKPHGPVEVPLETPWLAPVTLKRVE